LSQHREGDKRTILISAAKILKVPQEAIKSFNEESVLNVISNTFNSHDTSTLNAVNHNCAFNPLDKLMEAQEEIKKLHAEKEALYERLLKALEGK